ncbi:MAG: N-acetylmuramoyl-L-alanine amidase [Streptosporangiales bacterium]|nr:N-acetylmuramoyl-L-alanine amidase [Streptosporangiales bacterium]
MDVSNGMPVNRRTLFRGAALLAGGVAAAGVVDLTRSSIASRARAAAAPQVFDRAAWGARPPVQPAQVLANGPDHIVVHHTASANTGDLSQAAAFGLSRAIQNFHMDSNGWDDTGQQLTISRGGFVMEGRNRSLQAIGARQHVMGAHVSGENDHTIGIENEGTYMTTGPTGQLWNSLVATCAWLCTVYGLDPQAAIVGHRDYNATACPGDVLYARLPELRNAVAAVLAGQARPVGSSRRPRSSGLAGPRHTYDHGPALAANEGHR